MGIRKESDYGIFFVLKGLLVCLGEGMEVNWSRIKDIGQQKIMDMKSIPIVK